MTTVAEEDVLTAAELELAVEPLVDEVELSTDTPTEAPARSAGEPLFRILKGAPTDEDVAALVAVLGAAAANAPAASERQPVDGWGRATLMHRGSSPFSPYVYPLLSHLR
ncbi:acyl-CoA carboxylase epsilon subunit [Nocardia caishijiensis]|uniref:Acyl-CoA carboxylase epsilon subunit-like protein n=1 Tax=Nocardia caishijiensis TaxID=184756 RepID=A0ABQ6YS09_9NOCA|nr:acyl-CoA carboxylase epsilon subunit [Nocardia caishijiensis]KAF0848481.1 acyl-CoA carboxylase epsilon subunit-like protein [Nocardia caishijiensis]